MRGLGLLFLLCVCAMAPLAEGRATKRREEPAVGSKPRLSAGSPARSDPLPAGNCLVNGITLFNGAMWSPQPCMVCQCRRDTVKCRPTPCASTNKVLVGKDNKDRNLKQKNVHQRGSSKPYATRGGQDVKKKEQLVEKTRPAAVPVKPSPAQKKTLAPAAKPSTRGDKTLAPAAKAHLPEYHFPTSEEEHDDDDGAEGEDMDDEDDFVGPPPQIKVEPRWMTRAAPRAPLPRPGPVARARPAVSSLSQTPSFMESLPSGCLLSESLVACGSTGMTRMPMIPDQGVKTLYLADNKISKIPARALVGLPNLEWLDLSKNKLNDDSFSPMLFQNLTRLRRLILDGNNLTKIPAFLPPSLEELKINDNKLSGLTPSSFKGLSKLLTLELEDNNFHDGNVSPLTFRPLKKLVYLRLEDNKFRAIPSGLPSSLQELHLSDNNIEVVQAGILNKTTDLRVLDLSHNHIREDRISPHAWIRLLKLETLDLSHNKLVHVPSFLPPGLRRLILHHNQIELIPGYALGHLKPGLDSLHLSHNRLRDDGIDEVSFLGLFSSLSELLLDHNRLRSVPRGLLLLRNLQHLRLNYNLISHIPINALCDTGARDDSPLLSVHLENNLIDRRHIPPTAFSCIRNYHSILLWPQRYEALD